MSRFRSHGLTYYAFRILAAGLLACGAATTAGAALFGLTMLRGNSCSGGSSLRRARMVVREATNAVSLFTAVENRCPSSQSELLAGKFLGVVPRDPWGQQLFYRCQATPGGDATFTVRSAGPDRVFWTADDVDEPSP